MFAPPAGFNTRLQAWLARANTRWHRALGRAQRIEAAKAAMIGLPPVAPVVGGRHSTRLPRYVRLDGNDYPVPPAVTGRRIQARAAVHRVRVGRQLVADHAGWGRNTRRSGPGHLAAGCGLRLQVVPAVVAG